MRLDALLAHLLLAGACLAIADDAGVGPVAGCREAHRRSEWSRAEALCGACFARRPHPSIGVALARARLELADEEGALVAARSSAIGEQRGEALQIVGMILDRRGEGEPARAALAEALELSRARRAAAQAARASYAIAGSFWREARYRETLAALDDSAREAQAAEDARMIGYVALMRGDVLRAVGDARGAERAFRAADAALPLPSDRAYVRLKTGMLHRDAARPALSRAAFEEALSIARTHGLREVEAAAHLNLAYADHLVGHAEAGIAHLAGLADRPSVSYFYNHALLEADRGDLTEAARLFEAGAARVTTDEWRWDLLHEQGLLAERRGDLAGAERAYRESIAAVERLRAAADPSELQPWMLPRRRAPYAALFALLARAGRVDEALAALEAFTARSLLDALARAEGGDASTRAETIAALRSGLGAAGAAVDLGAREILVHVEAADRLWVVHRAARGVVSIVDRGDLGATARLIDRLAADLDDDAAARELGARLIPKAIGAGDQPLFVVPTGRFLGLAYAALRRGEERLIDQRPVVLAPSLRSFATRPLVAQPSGSLVIADADGSLPAAREEASEVARRIGTTPRTGSSATRALLGGGSFEVLHLGVHSGLDAEGAWLSLHDGRWTSRDVLGSKLHAEVVVLASCASASTRREELWGSLAAAFLANGSGAVIATLGSVDDRDARALVGALYRHDLESDPARALAAAQRDLARSLPPRRWASFVVYGAAGIAERPSR